jgi:hypothetical protein
MPTVGARVTVAFLDARVAGVIEEVRDDGRRLVVATSDGRRLTFALSRATGQFAEDGEQTGARLSFDDEVQVERS